MKQTLTRVLAALALFCGLSLPASAQVSQISGNISGSTCAPGGATTSCIQLGVAAKGTASVQIGGNWTGTITFTGSTLGGPFNNLGCTSAAAGSSPSNTTTSGGLFICPVAGLSVLRATGSGFSGSAHIDILATEGGGAAGGGGGAAGVVTQGTVPWVVSGDGTAGAASTGVLSVQGIASMTPISALAAQSGSWTVSQSGSPWGVAGSLSNNNAAPTSNQVDVMPCVVGASAPSYSDGRSVKPRCGTGGEQYVNVTNTSPVDANSYPFTVPAASATSTGAAVACNILSAASTNSTSCKGSAGNFYGYEIYNTTTTIYYLRMYNTASAPTCSSATGFIRSIPIPPAGASGQAGGAISNQVLPVNYTTGIGYCITASSGSTANDNAATGVFGEIRYK